MTTKRSTGHVLSTNRAFCCFWLSCDNRFLSYENLHLHTLDHLSEEQSEFCFWLYCPFPELSGLSHTQKRRHVLLHVFAESCRQLAVNVIDELTRTKTVGSEPCLRPPRDNWFTTELAPTSDVIKYGFKCMWKDCNVVSECAYLFRLHVVNHADTHPVKEEEETFGTVLRPDSLQNCTFPNSCTTASFTTHPPKGTFPDSCTKYFGLHSWTGALFSDLPSAPDLHEIIGGSDEENDYGPEGQEELTTPELVKRLRFAWQNEKLAPELLVARPQLVGLVQEELDRLEVRAKMFPKGDIKSQIILMQVDRLRYMLKDYLRTRIMKVRVSRCGVS
ncbi:unnamed protein product [Dibothriocephalus latus]|uniref:C2H2-type domain-containing protein n=1 Tax=Dibothriocephalus latus TaxID=60516 RepID=A0A3P7LH27_DIBLA|nr:unnamed protein product [Dibothriocephalus latus]